MAFQQPIQNPIKHRFTELQGRRSVIKSWNISIKDTFNLAYIYQAIRTWGIQNGWASWTDSDFKELWYVHRSHPTFGNEARIRWRWERAPDVEGKALFLYRMDIDYH